MYQVINTTLEELSGSAEVIAEELEPTKYYEMVIGGNN